TNQYRKSTIQVRSSAFLQRVRRSPRWIEESGPLMLPRFTYSVGIPGAPDQCFGGSPSFDNVREYDQRKEGGQNGNHCPGNVHGSVLQLSWPTQEQCGVLRRRPKR